MYEFPKSACNRVPQTRWFKTTHIYSVTILESRSPKSSDQEDHVSSETLGGLLPYLFLASGGVSWSALVVTW